MERFNYQSLSDVLDEDASILQMLEAESYGYKRDEQEKMDELEAEIAEQRQRVNNGQ